MFRTKTQRTVASLVLGVACLAAPQAAHAVTPVKLSGAIAGVVADTMGVPQMGATVLLFNRQERVAQKALTDERGGFQFAGLIPDLYSVRVTLASFIPAFRKDVQVRPGSASILNVNLSSLFSTIQISYPAIQNGNFMTD